MRNMSVRSAAFCLLSLLCPAAMGGVAGYQSADIDWQQLRPGTSARQTWAQTALQDYRYRLVTECLCALNGASTVYVLGGRVVRVEDAQGRVRDLPDALQRELTVEGLYRLIDRYAALRPDSMAWRLNRSLGFPELIRVDPSYRLGDDGLDYRISDLKRLLPR